MLCGIVFACKKAASASAGVAQIARDDQVTLEPSAACTHLSCFLFYKSILQRTTYSMLFKLGAEASKVLIYSDNLLTVQSSL